MVLSRLVDLTELTTATGTDNTPAQSWTTKEAVSSSGLALYLLRLQAMHQRLHRYQSRSFYVPCAANQMADDCSRLWHLSDSDLLAYFNATYPQERPWQVCHLLLGEASGLLSALLCTPQPLPAILSEQATLAASSRVGPNGAVCSTSAPLSPTSTTPSPSWPDKPTAIDAGSWLLEVPRSAHGLQRTLFDSLGKRLRTWATGTRGLTSRPAGWTSASPAFGRTGSTTTTRHAESSPSLSLSS